MKNCVVTGVSIVRKIPIITSGALTLFGVIGVIRDISSMLRTCSSYRYLTMNATCKGNILSASLFLKTELRGFLNLRDPAGILARIRKLQGMIEIIKTSCVNIN